MRRFILLSLLAFIARDGVYAAADPALGRIPADTPSLAISQPGAGAAPVYAVDERPPDLEPVPEAPEPSLPVQNGETMEPDITIIRKGKETIQEYRRGGRLYMIKVVPAVGPPYYFLDTNGDGKMDERRSELDRGSEINMWKLLEW